MVNPMSGADDEALAAELDHQVELLGSGRWHLQLAATRVLADAGQAGLDAVKRGLSNRHARVRRYCADFFDHYGDDRCVPLLQGLMRSDPVPRVRRAALHSLSCQRCKTEPLRADYIPILVEGLADPNRHVREAAASGLLGKPPDPRAVGPLRVVLDQEPDSLLGRLAHSALRQHDSAYRVASDAQARARAAARCAVE